MTDFEHDDLLKQLDCLNADVPPLPEDFHAGWAGRLEDDMETKRKAPLKTTLTRILAVAASLVFVVGGALMAQQAQEEIAAPQAASGSVTARSYASDAMAAKSYANEAAPMDMAAVYDVMEEDAEYEFTSDYGVEGGLASSLAQAPSERMLIRSASLTLGTQRYEESLNALRGLCENAGGWIASSSETVSSGELRVCYLTLRIPAPQLEGFLTGTAELGRVTRRAEDTQDVTESYRDTRARLETQQALMARLQALVTDAASLSDLLELEAQIADTQYQIDRLQSSLNSTDRQVNFSTVDVTLREERPAADITDGEKTLGERIRSALRAGAEAFLHLMENGTVFLAAALPFLAIVAVIWVIVALARKAIRRRKHRE